MMFATAYHTDFWPRDTLFDRRNRAAACEIRSLRSVNRPIGVDCQSNVLVNNLSVPEAQI